MCGVNMGWAVRSLEEDGKGASGLLPLLIERLKRLAEQGELTALRVGVVGLEPRV